MTKVNFTTSEYVRSHGKQPKGWGVWAFAYEAAEKGAPVAGVYFTPRAMSYTEAKAAAKAEFQRTAAAAGYTGAVSVSVQP